MEDKPIIKHCYNCKYCMKGYAYTEYGLLWCSVKYKSVNLKRARIRALFCRFFRKK